MPSVNLNITPININYNFDVESLVTEPLEKYFTKKLSRLNYRSNINYNEIEFLYY